MTIPHCWGGRVCGFARGRWPFLGTILAGIVIAIALWQYNTNGDLFYSFTLHESRRLSPLRSPPSRVPNDKALIPSLQTVEQANKAQANPNPNATPKSLGWSFSSWFSSSSTSSTVNGPERPAPVEISRTIEQTRPKPPEPVTHNSNFVLSAGARKEQEQQKHSSTSNSTSSKAGPKLFGKLTKAECSARFGDRHYLPLERAKYPPMLYTFPGSGNTWCRLLIEYATGIYTGSVYNDQSLLHSLPGEFTCNSQVSVIKIHPHTHPFEGLRTGNFNSDANKCKRGGINGIKRAILLIRDPFDSIWSEFQRRITQSHVGGVLKANFDWPRWQANAAALSHQYHLMWAVHHAGIERHFAKQDILYLKYEDLKDKNTRVATMRRVVDFLGISQPTDQQLECAFALADNRETHRTVDATLTMTKDEAYTIPLACRMWALFGVHAKKHGYHMWRNMDCSKLAPGTSAGPIAAGEGGALSAVPAGGTKENVYPPIPRVNVGGQGEYDRKWVQPGQPLLDFYGHPTAQPAGAPGKVMAGSRPRRPGQGRQQGGGRAGPGGAGGQRQRLGGGGAGQHQPPPPQQPQPTEPRESADAMDHWILKQEARTARAPLPGQSTPPAAAAAGADNSPAATATALLQQLSQPVAQNAEGDSAGRGEGRGAGGGGRRSKRGRGRQSGGRVGGLTMEEASKPGTVLATVGADKPAWE